MLETAYREGALKQETCYVGLAAMGRSPACGQFMVVAETATDLAVIWSRLFPDLALDQELCKRVTISNAPEQQQ